MQRIIQINIAGRLIPIEEDAYLVLRDYLLSLDRHFESEPGRDEIIQDIENRIAELFLLRLQAGTPAIDGIDVAKVIETLGPAYTLGAEAFDGHINRLPVPYVGYKNKALQRRLYRNPNDKMLGGVCGGIAAYFDIDSVIVRLILVVLILGAGIGFIAYLIAWIVIPLARTPEQLAQMSGERAPLTFSSLKKNMGEELQDLRKRSEEMTGELKDFFSRKR